MHAGPASQLLNTGCSLNVYHSTAAMYLVVPWVFAAHAVIAVRVGGVEVEDKHQVPALKDDQLVPLVLQWAWVFLVYSQGFVRGCHQGGKGVSPQPGLHHSLPAGRQRGQAMIRRT